MAKAFRLREAILRRKGRVVQCAGYSGEEGFLQALIDGQVAAIQAISGAGLAKGWDALAKSAKLAKLAKLAKVDLPDLPTGKLPNLPDGDLPEGFPGSCFVAGTPIQTEEGGKPIESLWVGDRVLTTDGSSSTSIEPANWRKIRLRMPNPEAPADILEIELLRTIQWIAATGCEPGTRMWFVLEEMGLRGWAEVIGIDACPVIEAGRGRVVLATVTHENTFVIELRLRGQEQPLLPYRPPPLVLRHAERLDPSSSLAARRGTPDHGRYRSRRES
ncbi:Hint domain-containing protein [Luteolibacter sp. GHJ8]|uniref:Hint domain-containing protein n=1 Tax=Luteolibacter rhizosphaerae TaxID=2989719 RepID=A0ABT3GAV5_9BACT|nr:Hint domain-containing protein [Luteolibacter rhizosphaerae]MCW1916972.1 Hint domain-containing protein [Luteolibacter rhizosphaerae]